MSLVEMLVATTLTTTVVGGVLGTLASAQMEFVSQSSSADVRQRLRVGVDAIRRDLLPATAALPFPGGILIVSGPAQHTYYVRAGTLRHDDGRGTDLPVLDDVAAMEFEAVGERRIRVRLEIRSTWKTARDAAIVFDVAPRNLGRGG
ncbi:MAG TPA: hypothetical protein VIX63_15035 [Vicinamibacterales bacterium]